MKKSLKTFLLTTSSLAMAAGAGAGGVVLVQKITHHQSNEQLAEKLPEAPKIQSDGVIEFTQSVRNLLNHIKLSLENVSMNDTSAPNVYVEDEHKLEVLKRHIKNADRILNIDKREIDDLRLLAENLRSQLATILTDNLVDQRAADISFIYDPSIILDWDKSIGYRKQFVDNLFGAKDELSSEELDERLNKMNRFILGCRAVFDLIGLQTNEPSGNYFPPQIMEHIEQIIKSSPEIPEEISGITSVLDFLINISLATN